MDITLFFVLPLIGGFAFVTQLSLLRYKTGREESQRLYYRAALYGVLLAIVAGIAHEIGQRTSASYARFARNVAAVVLGPVLEKERSTTSTALSPQAQALRIELATICIYAFVLGALTPLWNQLLLICDWLWIHAAGRGRRRSFLDRMNLRSIKDPLERMLARSLSSASLIQVTLSNSKVYVGSVLESLDPGSPAKYFRLQPWMSGHRGEDGMVEFNTFYDDILSAFEADPGKHEVVETFQLVIPVDKVLTASGFDVRAYERFLENRETPPADGSPGVSEASMGSSVPRTETIRLISAAFEAVAAALRLFR